MTANRLRNHFSRHASGLLALLFSFPAIPMAPSMTAVLTTATVLASSVPQADARTVRGAVRGTARRTTRRTTARLTTLPVGYRSVYVRGVPYFLVGSTYYQYVNGGYIVVYP